ncbi:MAG: ribosome small subunit-dependent GTPase A [Mariniblastus sp.]|nr:ribosome small subunit-dependent GTPase A [Mariniblastus sp.]
MGRKKRKNPVVRTDFRKRHDSKTRKRDFTREFHSGDESIENLRRGERISGKGDLTRKRTVSGAKVGQETGGFQVELQVDPETCETGRVISVHGLNSIVQTENRTYTCAIKGVLKSLSTDLQHVVVAGDHVTLQPIDEETGVIVRVEPRFNQLSRTSRQRQQIIVANIDLVLIVASAAEPVLKPNLIDRFLISAEKARIRPIIVINKVDLVDQADLQPVVGVWSQIGYQVLLVSAQTGQGIEALKSVIQQQDSVVTGQSGVGKSSILNAIQPGLELRVSDVSQENQKGRHTTTAAQLIPLELGGHLIDTPGIRQFQLWDVIAEEVGGYFRDIRPFVMGCRFPDCTHTHEEDCLVKHAVADGKIDVRRYESYCQIQGSDA